MFLQVIVAVTTTKSMQSVTNIFIVNLAMADMSVMLFCAPPSVIWDVTNTWLFGSIACRIVIYIQVSKLCLDHQFLKMNKVVYPAADLGST